MTANFLSGSKLRNHVKLLMKYFAFFLLLLLSFRLWQGMMNNRFLIKYITKLTLFQIWNSWKIIGESATTCDETRTRPTRACGRRCSIWQPRLSFPPTPHVAPMEGRSSVDCQKLEKDGKLSNYINLLKRINIFFWIVDVEYATITAPIWAKGIRSISPSTAATDGGRVRRCSTGRSSNTSR